MNKVIIWTINKHHMIGQSPKQFQPINIDMDLLLLLFLLILNHLLKESESYKNVLLTKVMLLAYNNFYYTNTNLK